MTQRQNYISLFTQPELEAGLALLYGPEAAHRVAAEVYSIPVQDQIYYDWIEPALYLMACVSDDLDRRVREMGGDGDAGAAFHARIDEFQAWLPTISDGLTPGLNIRDVISDSRLDESTA